MKKAVETRVLSLLIVAVLLVGIFTGVPIDVSAAPLGVSSVTSYEGLRAALEDSSVDTVIIPDGEVVTFINDNQVEIPAEKTLLIEGVLDLQTTKSASAANAFKAVTNYGTMSVEDGGELICGNYSGSSVAYSVYNCGSFYVKSGGTFSVEVSGTIAYGLYGHSGDIILDGTVNLKNSGNNSRGIYLKGDMPTLHITGGTVNVANTGGRGIDGTATSDRIEMSGGTMNVANETLIAVTGSSNTFGIALDCDFLLSGGEIIVDNFGDNSPGLAMRYQTCGIWLSGYNWLILAGGTINIQNDVEMRGLRSDGVIWHLVDANAITGPIYDSSQTKYGTFLQILDAETKEPLGNPTIAIKGKTAYTYPPFEHNGEVFYPLSEGMQLTVSASGYETFVETLVDFPSNARQTKVIHLTRTFNTPPSLGVDVLSLRAGGTGEIDVDMGAGVSTASYVTVSSSDPLVASISTSRLNKNGQIVVTGEAAGTATITFAFQVGSTQITKTVAVTVLDADPGVQVPSRDNFRLNGTTLRLATGADGIVRTNVPTAANKLVTWKSSNPAVAAISAVSDQDFASVLVDAQKAGMTLITATYEGRSQHCYVYVRDAGDSSYHSYLSVTEATLSVGDTFVVVSSESGIMAGGGSNITWSVAPEGIVSLSPNGNFDNFARTITALSPGTATISAKDSHNYVSTCTVTVTGDGTGGDDNSGDTGGDDGSGNTGGDDGSGGTGGDDGAGSNAGNAGNTGNTGSTDNENSGGGGGGGGSRITAGASSSVPVVATLTSTDATAAVSSALAANRKARIARTGTIQVPASVWALFGDTPVQFDTLQNKGVQVRVTVNQPGSMTTGMQLSGQVSGAVVDKYKALFQKWFGTEVYVIHFDQSGEWGQPVEIAAKLDFSGVDLTKLNFYAYNAKTNTYRRIPNSNYTVDKNGYIHFTTTYAGTIIISEGPLKK
ncbi:hypothetical protein LJC63_07310 [Ruminococcaceae bacterium OttesenSCG-928-L11]|nr:hypothetical protein [Ruminococcaceae bacterium OttesenSCG-928-L11]